MSTPSDSQPESPASELERLNLETARAGLRKLHLEIENLQAPHSRYIPVITAVISILGFLSGIAIFTFQHDSDRLSRDQNRYSTGSQELLGFPHQNIGVARALALRRDLDGLIDSLYPSELQRQKVKQDLTHSINNLLATDCDFTQARQVHLDIAALQYWEDYRQGCEGAFNVSIIDKYVNTLAELQRNKGALKNMKIIESDENPDPESVIGEPYISLFKGYMCHYNLLTDDEQKSRMQRRMTAVTESDTLPGEIEQSVKCPIGTLIKAP